MRLIFFALLLTASAHAQWDLQNSGSTADLRGIHSIGKGIAWASGSNGTVLRTEDGGHLWQRCTVPAGAEKLDFRGIQAFDANTAIVMSSGKGDLSRLYKTTDGCQTWKLVFTNPDAEGFWDAIKVEHANRYCRMQMDNGFGSWGIPLTGDSESSIRQTRRCPLSWPMTQKRLPNRIQQQELLQPAIQLSLFSLLAQKFQSVWRHQGQRNQRNITKRARLLSNIS